MRFSSFPFGELLTTFVTSNRGRRIAIGVNIKRNPIARPKPKGTVRTFSGIFRDKKRRFSRRSRVRRRPERRVKVVHSRLASRARRARPQRAHKATHPIVAAAAGSAAAAGDTAVVEAIEAGDLELAP